MTCLILFFFSFTYLSCHLSICLNLNDDRQLIIEPYVKQITSSPQSHYLKITLSNATHLSSGRIGTPTEILILASNLEGATT